MELSKRHFSGFPCFSVYFLFILKIVILTLDSKEGIVTFIEILTAVLSETRGVY